MEEIVSILVTIITGILIGAIIGYIFFRDIKYVGPNSNKIVKETYIDTDGKKFKFKPNVCVCPSNYSMNKLHDPNFKESH